MKLKSPLMKHENKDDVDDGGDDEDGGDNKSDDERRQGQNSKWLSPKDTPVLLYQWVPCLCYTLMLPNDCLFFSAPLPLPVTLIPPKNWELKRAVQFPIVRTIVTVPCKEGEYNSDIRKGGVILRKLCCHLYPW